MSGKMLACSNAQYGHSQVVIAHDQHRRRGRAAARRPAFGAKALHEGSAATSELIELRERLAVIRDEEAQRLRVLPFCGESDADLAVARHVRSCDRG